MKPINSNPQVDQLLTTKLFIPPTRPELVSRPGLIERLNRGQHGKFTLISAPAGFGKTTLVTEWLEEVHQDSGREVQIETRIAWLSLDEGDNDPARFLTYFVAAVNQIEGMEENLGQGVLSMLQSPQPPPNETILTALINELVNIPDRLIFVLDDYHLIDDQPVQDMLSFLLDNLPPQMHLVIATRVDPHLSLSRLRAQDQLTELRAADLRFTTSEAADFLNKVMGFDLSEGDIAALESRTEGWIAGLQLAAISMQGREDVAGFIKSFTGSHRLVLDYLVEEVLKKQPENIQTFLMQTAILERLNGFLCNALTGHQDGQETLEFLDQANLFIVPLDDERRWYRYHHLFADLLRNRMRQRQPDWAAGLHERASQWYEQNGLTAEAIEHALKAENFERAARLIEGVAEAVWGRGEHTKLRRWLASLPDELVLSKPHLSILEAWSRFASGQQDAAEKSLQAAEKALYIRTDYPAATSPIEPDQSPDSDRMKIQGRAATIRAFMAFFRGDVQELSKYAHQALEYLPQEDLMWRSTAMVALGDAYSFTGDLPPAVQVRQEALEASKAAGNFYMVLIASMKLAVTLRMQGRLEQVVETCQQQFQLANERGLSQTGEVGWLLAIWGEVLAEVNDLEGAIQQAVTGVELTERGNDLGMIGWSYLCLMRVLFSSGNAAGAEEIIQKAEHLNRQHHIPPWITSPMAAWQARVWLAQGKLESVSQWVGERGLDADGDPSYLHETEYIVLTRILIAQGRLDETSRLLERLLKTTTEGGRTSRMIEVLMLQALAFQAWGDTDQAVTRLERALGLARPGGFTRIFVDEGPAMAQLLHEALSRDIAPDYVCRLLAAFPKAGSDRTAPSKLPDFESEWYEQLSERELEVLQLIAEGLTNPDIATRLYLSTQTVKVHTRNIYSKLGVHNRTQAVARGRSLGILLPT